MTRAAIKITGPDCEKFLQGLITNDLRFLDKNGLLYAALLTPQGKYLADFFVLRKDEGLLLDAPETLGEYLLNRLSLYKLRAAVQLELAPIAVARGLGPVPEGAYADPRHPALGWRHYGDPLLDQPQDWDAIRVTHCIPEAGTELVPDETYILEAGFERLKGVDFRKGCYVGQEVTARMQHKTELRKGFVTVTLDGSARSGTEIVSGAKIVGKLCTRAGDKAIAYLRFDRADMPLMAAETRVFWEPAPSAA